MEVHPGVLTLQRIKGLGPSEKQWLVIMGILLAVLGVYLLVELVKRL